MWNKGLYCILLLAWLSTCVTAFVGTTKTVPVAPQPGPVQAIFTSGLLLPFDGPKLNQINSTVFDWWYFDAVSADGSTQVAIVFFNTEATSLGFGSGLGTVNFVFFTAYFPNSTIYQQIIPANVAKITTLGNGSSGSWNGTGASWAGTPDLSSYTIDIDSPTIGIKGSLSLKSVAPPRFPCNFNLPFVSEHLTDPIGWANAIPDADAVSDFLIGDFPLKFSGYGYHDKNWGIDTLPNTIGSWYWGHARVGPYSIVFFDTLEHDNTESVSGYLVKNGKVVSLGCSGLTVRPVDQAFPPPPGAPLPKTLHLEFHTDDGLFIADFSGPVIWDAPLPNPNWGYTRFAGAIKGGIKGKTQYTGASTWEWIRYPN